MSRILIVEDESNMLMGLRDNLEFEGYTVETAGDGQIGLEKALNDDFDLIILDVMLPKRSGYDVCKAIRSANISIPVIFLSAKGEEIDKVIGLEIGADDYITKPFGLRELLARIKAVLRRKGNTAADSAPSKVKIGKLEMDFDRYRAFSNDQSIKMSHKEFEILKYMWENANKVVSRDDLLENIWGYNERPNTRTVDNFMVKIRQKIESDPNDPQLILTVHGIGYKLLIHS